MKYCVHCEKTYSEKFNFCPVCAERLIDKKEFDEKHLAELERQKQVDEIHKIEREYQALKKQVCAVYDYFEYQSIFPAKIHNFSFSRIRMSVKQAQEALEILKDYADSIMFHKIRTPKKMYEELMVTYEKILDNSRRIKVELQKAKAKELPFNSYLRFFVNKAVLEEANINAYINGGTYRYVYDSGVSKKFMVTKSLKSRIAEDILKGSERTLGVNYLHLKQEFEVILKHQNGLYFSLVDFLSGIKNVGIEQLELDKYTFVYFSENYLKKI